MREKAHKQFKLAAYILSFVMLISASSLFVRAMEPTNDNFIRNDAYTEFLKTAGLPDNFVTYEQISEFGQFESLEYYTEQYDHVTYHLWDEDFGDFSLSIDMRESKDEFAPGVRTTSRGYDPSNLLFFDREHFYSAKDGSMVINIGSFQYQYDTDGLLQAIQWTINDVEFVLYPYTPYNAELLAMEGHPIRVYDTSPWAIKMLQEDSAITVYEELSAKLTLQNQPSKPERKSHQAWIIAGAAGIFVAVCCVGGILWRKRRPITMVNFKRGKIQINDLTIHQFTGKKEVEARDDWHLFSQVPGYSHFAYTGDLTDTELYAIHLCFKENRLLWIDFWPRTKHCAYHILPERPSQDTSFFCNHLDLMAREVSAWMRNKQLSLKRKYLWGRAVLIVDFDRGLNTNVRMMYGIFQK